MPTLHQVARKKRMTKDAKAIRAAIRQQLEADQLLGVRSVPMACRVDAAHQENVTYAAGDAHSATEDNAKKTHDKKNHVAFDKEHRLLALDESQVKGCTQCGLSQTRTQTVFGQGSADARLMFVGEAPGFEEDKQGLAFVGRAGQLLTRMVEAMGLTRDEIYICNVLKCRPPGNRNPSSEEIIACSPFLHEQIAVVRPAVLVALGAPAAKTLLDTNEAIGKLRGRFHDYFLTDENEETLSIPLMPTYHPAYLLRSPGEKRKAWEDLQMVMKLLGLPIPEKPIGSS